LLEVLEESFSSQERLLEVPEQSFSSQERFLGALQEVFPSQEAFLERLSPHPTTRSSISVALHDLSASLRALAKALATRSRYRQVDLMVPSFLLSVPASTQ
jgi:hypothetical protein